MFVNVSEVLRSVQSMLFSLPEGPRLPGAFAGEPTPPWDAGWQAAIRGGECRHPCCQNDDEEPFGPVPLRALLVLSISFPVPDTLSPMVRLR